MPLKIDKKITYSVDIKIPSLQFEKQMEVDERGLNVVYGEIDDLARALADIVGAIRLPRYRTPTASSSASSNTARRVMEYAETHADFTIKGISECIGIPTGTLYGVIVKLVEEGALTKEQVAGGIAHIYALKKKPEKKDDIVVLPEGKQPFPPLNNPEREKMQALRG